MRDNLDGSTEELLDLDTEACEIQFDGVEYFYLRESPSPDGYGCDTQFARSAMTATIADATQTARMATSRRR